MRIKRMITRLFSVLIMTICCCFIYQGGASEAHAETEMFTQPESFNSIEGNGKYIGKDYTYHLDMEKVGITGKMYELMNKIENVFFGLEVMIAKAAVYVFYYCMSFDAASMLSGQLYAIQDVLHSAIFEPLLYVVLGLTTIKLANRMMRKNFIGILSDCGYVILMMILSVFVIYHSDTIVSNTTTLSKSVGLEAMVGLNNTMAGKNDSSGGNFLDNYTAGAAGTLWENMVHRPWLQLEFDGGEPDQALIEDLMSAKTIEERNRYIEESELECFAKEKAGNDLGTIIMYLIPLIIKSGIYIVLAAVQIFFQVVAVFFVILAPVILILSMIPGYDFQIIEIWLKKILEFEIGIVISTMMIAFLIYLDNYMFSLTYGWFMCYILQIIVAVSLYLGRRHIFGLFGKLQRVVRNPGYGKAMLKNAGDIKYRTLPAIRRTNIGVSDSQERIPARNINLQNTVAQRKVEKQKELEDERKNNTVPRPNLVKNVEKNRNENIIPFQDYHSTPNESIKQRPEHNKTYTTNKIKDNAEKTGMSMQHNMTSNVNRREPEVSGNKVTVQVGKDPARQEKRYEHDGEKRHITTAAERERKIEASNENQQQRRRKAAGKPDKPIMIAAFTTPTINIRERDTRQTKRTRLVNKETDERTEKVAKTGK